MASLKLPWKLRFIFAVYRLILRLSRCPNNTVNRRLFNFFDLKTSPSQTPLDGVVTSDTVITSSRELWFRIFTPVSAHGRDDSGDMAVVVYFHGGGFAFQSASSIGYDKLCRRFARELSAVVISVNYRLSPEHQCPVQYEDGFDALRFLDANFDQIPVNANPKRCFLAGDSAGGNLAHHVAVKGGEFEFSRLKLIGLIAIQPFFGGEERTGSETRNDGAPLLSLEDTDWFWRAFLPNGSDRDHPAANVFGPKSTVDISRVKYPATLVLIGGLDILNDWQRKYYDGLKRGGKEVELVEHPNSFHASFIFEEFPEYFLFVKEIREFIQKQIDKESRFPW